MNKHRNLSSAAILLSLLTFASAQAYDLELEQQVGIFGAYQHLDDLDDGGGLGLKYVVMWPGVTDAIDLGCDVRFSGLTGYSAGADIDAYPLEFTGLVRKELAETTRLYVGPGIGYYWFDKDNGAANIDDSIGVYAVLGIEQSLTEDLVLSVEAKYLYVDTDATGVGVRQVDDVAGVGATLGVAYRW